MLRDLAGQLESLFDGGVPERGGDPTRDRLFPRAYLDPTEDEAESEWQVAVHEDLVRQKSAAVGALVDSLDTGTAKRKGTHRAHPRPEVVEQWVSALNDVRLALGVVLEVTEDEIRLEPDDPRAPGPRALRLADLAPGIAGRGAAGRRRARGRGEPGEEED